MSDISDIRKEYKLKTLNEKEVAADPLSQFRTWWTEAINSSIEEPNAMTLATTDEKGNPSARIVLLKGFDENGFVFFTNYESHKAKDLEKNPRSAIVFFWKELERQVRIEGTVAKVSAADSNTYFQSRPHGSQIGAWSSPQSAIITGREILEQKADDLDKQFMEGAVPCPPFWGGYVVKPTLVEFWQGRPDRLHDRIQYSYRETSWKVDRLAP